MRYVSLFEVNQQAVRGCVCCCAYRSVCLSVSVVAPSALWRRVAEVGDVLFFNQQYFLSKNLFIKILPPFKPCSFAT